MKEEEEDQPAACMTNVTQSLEREFIKSYERLPILWDVKHPDYTNKYRRHIAIDTLLKIMKKWDRNATRLAVRQKINILRSSYRKDLRRHLSSKTIGPDGQENYEYNPKNWKFYALRFLGGKLNEDVEHVRNSSILEINLDNANFDEDEESKESVDDENSSHTSDVLQPFSEEKYNVNNHTNAKEKSNKRMKLEVPDYIVDDSILDREFEAIGSNVACKLKRMNAQQRYHAELLINKVLIEGLKDKLTENTELTEVYK